MILITTKILIYQISCQSGKFNKITAKTLFRITLNAPKWIDMYISYCKLKTKIGRIKYKIRCKSSEKLGSILDYHRQKYTNKIQRI